MMWFNVKLNEEYATRLEGLLRSVRIERGEQTSKADLFRLLIDFVIANKSLFLTSCRTETTDDVHAVTTN